MMRRLPAGLQDCEGRDNKPDRAVKAYTDDGIGSHSECTQVMGKAVGAYLQLLVSQNLGTCYQSHSVWGRHGLLRHQLLYTPVDWKRSSRGVPCPRGKRLGIGGEPAARGSREFIGGDRVWQLHQRSMPKISSSTLVLTPGHVSMVLPSKHLNRTAIARQQGQGKRARATPRRLP